MIILAIAAVLNGSSQPSGCLGHVAKTRQVIISEYDRSHDVVANGTISCNFGLTAGEVESDLKRIVDAAKAKNCRGLMSVSLLPLSVNFQNGRTNRLTQRTLCRRQVSIKDFIISNERQFSRDLLKLIGWRGAFLGNDEILVNAVKKGPGRPHLKLIAIGPI